MLKAEVVLVGSDSFERSAFRPHHRLVVRAESQEGVVLEFVVQILRTLNQALANFFEVCRVVHRSVIGELLRQSQAEGPEACEQAVQSRRGSLHQQAWPKRLEHIRVAGINFDSAIMPDMMQLTIMAIVHGRRHRRYDVIVVDYPAVIDVAQSRCEGCIADPRRAESVKRRGRRQFFLNQDARGREGCQGRAKTVSGVKNWMRKVGQPRFDSAPHFFEGIPEPDMNAPRIRQPIGENDLGVGDGILKSKRAAKDQRAALKLCIREQCRLCVPNVEKVVWLLVPTERAEKIIARAKTVRAGFEFIHFAPVNEA